jgi:hypothetical protein
MNTFQTLSTELTEAALAREAKARRLRSDADDFKASNPPTGCAEADRLNKAKVLSLRAEADRLDAHAAEARKGYFLVTESDQSNGPWQWATNKLFARAVRENRVTYVVPAAGQEQAFPVVNA